MPGLLVWAALLYAVAGTAAAHRIGRPLAGLNFAQQRAAAPAGTRLFVPQRPYLPQGTLRETLCHPHPTNAYPEADQLDALRAVGLDSLADAGGLDAPEPAAARLSPGEAQRLAVARALLARPQWLFLDESTAALDEPAQARVHQAIRRWLPAAGRDQRGPPRRARRLSRAAGAS